MVRLVLPYLNNHPNCQEEHLHREGRDGSCYAYTGGEEISMWLPTGRTVEKSYTDYDGIEHKWTDDEHKLHYFVRLHGEEDYRDMTPEEYKEFSKLTWEEREKLRIEKMSK